MKRPSITAHAAVERRNDTADALSYDWSYPDRHRVLPDHAQVITVGLNGGYPGIVNPYLNYQLGSAVKASDHTEIYVNTNNPGKHDSDLWPTSNTDKRGNKVKNPYGTCRGEDSVACSYMRGRDLAEVDQDKWLTQAASKTGATIKKIWLDVEGKPWQKGTEGQLGNVALLEGMANQFNADGFEVGIYAPPNPWQVIVGNQVTPKSVLRGLDEWLPTGGNSLDTAKAACENTAFTGGHITMTQYGTKFHGQTILTDYLCSQG